MKEGLTSLNLPKDHTVLYKHKYHGKNKQGIVRRNHQYLPCLTVQRKN